MAVHLLVLAEGQDDAPARALSAGEQVLYGLELGHEHVLDVQCPPAPDPLVVDLSREGVTLPLPLGARDHGNHVLVGNEHGRLEGGVGSRQRQQDGLAHQLEGGVIHEVGIGVPDEAVEGGELREVGLLACPDGSAAKGRGEVALCGKIVQVRIVALVCVVGVDVDGVHGACLSARGPGTAVWRRGYLLLAIRVN